MKGIRRTIFGKSAVAFATCAALGLIMLGCGGGGGGSTTPTGIPNAVPGNVIFYHLQPSSGNTETIGYVKPDGTGDTVYATYDNTVFEAVVPDPTTAKQAYFGYRPSGSAGQEGIYRNNAISGTGATEIVAPTFDGVDEICLSPDGKFLYYTQFVSGNPSDNLYRVSTTPGSTPTLVVSNVYEFTLDPTGTILLYTQQLANVQLFTTNADGSGSTTQVTNQAQDAGEPQYSKDGKKIIFSVYDSNGDGGNNIWTVKPDGTNLTQLTTSTDGLHSPTLSEDATKMAYVSLSLAGFYSEQGIYIANADGTNGLAVKLSPLIDAGMGSGAYWTSSTGRGMRGPSVSFGRHRRIKHA